MEEKWVVTCLTRGYPTLKEYDLLIDRNKSIEEHVFPRLPQAAAYVICHEGNITEEQQSYILSFTNVPFQFLEFTFHDDNRNVREEALLSFRQENYFTRKYPIGYNHMCHFWFIDFLDIFKDFDRLLRIDEDCIVKWFSLEHVTNNDIVVVHEQRMDHPLVIQHLDRLCNYFCEIHQLPPFAHSFRQIRCPYTNVMIVNIRSFCHDHAKHQWLGMFQKMVHDSGAIYTNRWGDLPLWGVYAAMICQQEDIIGSSNFMMYFHGSHNKMVGKPINHTRKKYISHK